MKILLLDGLIMGGFFLLSYFIAYLSIPLIAKAAQANHILDKPDNNRKLHSRAIPTLGGVAIFFAFLISFSVSPWAGGMEGFPYFVGALLVLLFVGLKDDLVILSAPTKLMAQVIAACLVIFGSGIAITNFHGILGLAEIPFWLTVPVTVFTVVVVINAVNLIDGIDGLAGGIGAIASFLFGGAFLYVGELPLAMFSLCLAGSLLGFLYFNFSPASIFMGDTGSLILGFLLAVQAIKFISLSSVPEFYAIFTNAAPILTVTILAFPLYDTLRVVFKRYRRNKSIFQPGQDHVHHELLRMGFNHKTASLLLYGQTLALVMLMGSLALLNVDVNILLVVLLLTSTVIYPTNGFKRRLMHGIFGLDWHDYRTSMWGIELQNRHVSVNGNGAARGHDHSVNLKTHANGNGKNNEEPNDREESVESMIA